VVVATETGVITVYDTTSWQVVQTIRGDSGVRQIAFDPKDRDLLVAWEAGHTQFGHVQIIALGMQRAFPWHQVAAAVRDVAYAPDGETIGFVCADGGTWLYAVHGDTWAYSHDHDTDVFTGRFSPDGKLFASSDRRGVVVVRGVAATLTAAITGSPRDSQ
jgi:WD40 repeat protein